MFQQEITRKLYQQIVITAVVINNVLFKDVKKNGLIMRVPPNRPKEIQSAGFCIKSQ